MLQYSTIQPRTLDILRRLMAIPQLSNFELAGGTALALHYGHRLSVDLDLFSGTDFVSSDLLSILELSFPDFIYSAPNVVGIFGFIENIKVDFVRYHQHPRIAPLIIEDGIRLLHPVDIMAMKVAAILKRAVKKDFWDIAELLDHYTVEEMINSYNAKFPNQQLLISIPQAITYFSDADESEDPISLKGQTWHSVKKKIQRRVNEYLS